MEKGFDFETCECVHVPEAAGTRPGKLVCSDFVG